jgi:chemotaxis protein MotB
MARELARSGETPMEDESYLVSLSDLMVGLVFVFVIMLMAFALSYRTAEQETQSTLEVLEVETEEVLAQKEQLAQELASLAAERDLLARDRDRLADERDRLLLQRDSLGEVTSALLDQHEVRDGMLATVQDLLRGRDVEVVIDPANGVLRLPESLLFESAEAVLRPEGVRALRELATVLARTLPCYSDAPAIQQADCPLPPRPLLEAVLVEGHTDDRPIRTAAFADNWELASARALNTYRALAEFEASLLLLLNQRGEALLGVSAYEAQRPVATAATDEARRQNRRIDLRFLLAAPDEAELTRIRREIDTLAP